MHQPGGGRTLADVEAWWRKSALQLPGQADEGLRAVIQKTLETMGDVLRPGTDLEIRRSLGYLAVEHNLYEAEAMPGSMAELTFGLIKCVHGTLTELTKERNELSATVERLRGGIPSNPASDFAPVDEPSLSSIPHDPNFSLNQLMSYPLVPKDEQLKEENDFVDVEDDDMEGNDEDFWNDIDSEIAVYVGKCGMRRDEGVDYDEQSNNPHAPRFLPLIPKTEEPDDWTSTEADADADADYKPPGQSLKPKKRRHNGETVTKEKKGVRPSVIWNKAFYEWIKFYKNELYEKYRYLPIPAGQRAYAYKRAYIRTHDWVPLTKKEKAVWFKKVLERQQLQDAETAAAAPSATPPASFYQDGPSTSNAAQENVDKKEPKDVPRFNADRPKSRAHKKRAKANPKITDEISLLIAKSIRIMHEQRCMPISPEKKSEERAQVTERLCQSVQEIFGETITVDELNEHARFLTACARRQTGSRGRPRNAYIKSIEEMASTMSMPSGSGPSNTIKID